MRANPPLAGWTITLYDIAGDTWTTTTSAANGTYIVHQ